MNRKSRGALARRMVPSPSMIVALLALAVAMSGTAYAAAKINGKNIKAGTITSKQIKKSTITSKQIKKSTITGKQVKDGSLTSGDLAAGTIPAGPAAYTTKNAAQVNIPSDLNTDNAILSKAVPAGKYAVTAHVNGFYLTDNGSDEANLVCRARVNGTTVQTGQAGNDAGIFLFAATGGTLNIPFDFTVDAPAAATISIDCSGGYDSPGALQGEYVSAGAAALTAITVSSIG